MVLPVSVGSESPETGAISISAELSDSVGCGLFSKKDVLIVQILTMHFKESFEKESYKSQIMVSRPRPRPTYP